MSKLVTGCYAALLILLVAAPAAASAAAPPEYQSSEPSDGETVHRPPDRVEATFDQPLDEASTLEVTDECGRRVDDRATDVSANTMSVGLAKKPSGKYVVEYFARGLAGVTGESRGRFSFTVHGGESCDGSAAKHDHHTDDDHSGGHAGHGEHGGGGGGHGSGDHDTTAGPGSDHSADHSTDHAAGTATHTDHGDANTDDHAGHGSGGHAGGHDDHAGEGGGSSAAGVPGITSSDTSRNVLNRADSTTLLVALGLCVVLGVLGGAILRTTTRPR